MAIFAVSRCSMSPRPSIWLPSDGLPPLLAQGEVMDEEELRAMIDEFDRDQDGESSATSSIF